MVFVGSGRTNKSSSRTRHKHSWSFGGLRPTKAHENVTSSRWRYTTLPPRLLNGSGTTQTEPKARKSEDFTCILCKNKRYRLDMFARKAGHLDVRSTTTARQVCLPSAAEAQVAAMDSMYTSPFTRNEHCKQCADFCDHGNRNT